MASKKPARKKTRAARPSNERPNTYGGSLEEVLDQVRSARRVVVLISPIPPVDDLVLLACNLMGRAKWLDATRLAEARAVASCKRWNEQLGHASNDLRLGYYLFVDGTARAYQSGLIDYKRDQLGVSIGALTALLGIWDGDASWVRGGTVIISAGAALRVISAFMEVIAADDRAQAAAPNTSAAPPHSSKPPPRGSPPRSAPRTSWSTPPPPSAPAIDEIAVAFETMGLSPTATRSEVKARYRDLAKQWHPDRFGGNAATANDAAMRMMQINVANSVICAARGW